jgi:hypothetical protein
MKNKKLIYVLLPAAVLIWGFIILKIIVKVRQPVKEFQMQQSSIQPGTDILQRDTITLIADYRDPFLGDGNTQVKPNRKVVEPKDRAFKLQKEPTLSVQWPEVSYKGTITNNRDDQHTGLVRIEDADFLIHKGDMIKEIFFVEIYSDSIKAVFQNESKTIMKKR